MGRSAVSSVVGLAALAVAFGWSSSVLAQLTDAQRRSMGNLDPNASRRSMGNLRPEAPSAPPQSSASGGATAVVPGPVYQGRYPTRRVYPAYRNYGYPYGYGYGYGYPYTGSYYAPGYYYRYYSLPPVVYPSGALFGPAAVQRFMRGR